MYDHIGLKVKDLDASVRFYKEALAPLGIVLDSRTEQGAGLGQPGAPALWLSVDAKAPQSAAHVALRARKRADVDGFHRQGLAAGGRDNGKPGVRADYAANYYAAFLIDPDGNNVEAVCME